MLPSLLQPMSVSWWRRFALPGTALDDVGQEGPRFRIGAERAHGAPFLVEWKIMLSAASIPEIALAVEARLCAPSNMRDPRPTCGRSCRRLLNSSTGCSRG